MRAMVLPCEHDNRAMPTPRSTAASADAPIPAAALPALAIAAFASGVSMRLTDAMLPLFARDFGVSLAQAAGVITAFSIAYGARNSSSARSATASASTA
jgi:hypothetical protein